jgi:hypothetical protein
MPQDWHGQLVPLSFDELAVLSVLDRDSDDDDVYRRGATAFEASCHVGRRRLKAALRALAAPLPGKKDDARPPLLQPVPGPRGRVDYRLLIPAATRVEGEGPTGAQTFELAVE